MGKFRIIFIKNFKKYIRLILNIIIFILIFQLSNREVRSLDLNYIFKEIFKFPLWKYFVFGILGIITILIYNVTDLLLSKHFNISKDYFTTVNFISNSLYNVTKPKNKTVNNIKSLLFVEDERVENIEKYNILDAVSVDIGISFLAIISTFILFTIDIHIEYKLIFLAILLLGISFIFMFYFLDRIVNRLFDMELPKLENENILKVKLYIWSIIESLSILIFFILLSNNTINDINIFTFFLSYTLARILGIISRVPGEFGVFDVSFLLLMKLFNYNVEEIFISLTFYRFFYYLIPSILGILLGLSLQKRENTSLITFDKSKKLINKTSGIFNNLIAILVLFSGVSLLTSVLFPNLAYNIDFFRYFLPEEVIDISNPLLISVSFLLIFISNEIRRKVKRSYSITMFLLFLGVIFSLFKAFSIINVLYLLSVMLVLRLYKSSFYRLTTPVDWFKTIIALIAFFILILSYMETSHLIIKNPYKNRIYIPIARSIILFIPFFTFIVIYELTKKRIEKDDRIAVLDENKMEEFLKDNSGNFLTNLVFLNDKFIFWSEEDDAFLQYSFGNNLAIVLGDPIGNSDSFQGLIANFRKFVDEYGYKTSFYQVNEENLSFYHDNGYYLFKLGETAIVELEEFTLESPKSRDFRNTLRRLVKDGYEFEFYNSNDYSDKLIEELKKVSDAWLKGRKEMGFSLGKFDVDYLNKSSLGIVRKVENGEIVSFASISPSYDGKSVSLDLMRHIDAAPANTITFLLLNLIIYYKENNYKYFNLGMAPLSNVGMDKNSHRQEKIAHLVYEYGDHFYSFEGLRKYKNKFNPNWSGRYLVYEDITLLPTSLLESASIIHK